MAVFIGVSGWRYAGWRAVFYPQGLAQSRELAFASRQVDTIEINGSHCSLAFPLAISAQFCFRTDAVRAFRRAAAAVKST